MLVLPSMTRPASRIRVTMVASYGGRQPSRIFEPAVVGTPRVAMTSLTATGTPASGPSFLAPPAAGVDRRGRGERALGVDVQERVHPLVDLGDAVQVGLGDLDRGDLAGGEQRAAARRRL